jgi:hypothetical protein
MEDHLGEDKSLETTVGSMKMKSIKGRKRKYRITDA